MGVNINEDAERTAYEASRPRLAPPLAQYLVAGTTDLPQAPTTLAEVSRLAGVPMQPYELASAYQVYVQVPTPGLARNYAGAGNYCHARGSHGFHPDLRGAVIAVCAYLPTETLAALRHERP